MDNKRKQYILAKIDVIRLNAHDIITASNPEKPNDDNGGNSIGGGMDKNGWT